MIAVELKYSIDQSKIKPSLQLPYALSVSFVCLSHFINVRRMYAAGVKK